MIARMGRLFAILSAVAAAISLSIGHAAEPIRVMILDGESGGPWHDWQAVSQALETVLEETGLFDVAVVTAPPADGDFDGFEPDFSAFDTVLLNYEAPDERWPAALKSSFERYVRNGGGLVAVHAADNAFPGWRAYNEMLGVGGWAGRDERSGPYWHYEDGELVADDSPGAAGSHGRRLPFAVTLRDTTHPITEGLPEVWLHGEDELYAELRGPGENMRVLATAYSDPGNAGSGRHEPQLMVLTYGTGRVFHTTMGHDVRGISSVDFVVTLQRGTEWTATGSVTQAVPETFPSAETVSYRADLSNAAAGEN